MGSYMSSLIMETGPDLRISPGSRIEEANFETGLVCFE